MIMFLFILTVATSGAIGYFLAYTKNERERRKEFEKRSKRNPKAGWYAYC